MVPGDWPCGAARCHAGAADFALVVEMPIELRDRVVIEAPPGKVWRWLEHLPAHYRDWHPDHVSCRWIRGNGLVPGAELEVVELLHGKEHRLRMRAVSVDPGRRVDYVVFPGLTGRFELVPEGEGTALTATLRIGVRWPVIGPVIDRLLSRALGGRIEAIRKHQRDEGRNLKALIETADRAGE